MRASLVFAIALFSAGAVACATTTTSTSSPDSTANDTVPTTPDDEPATDDGRETTSSSSTSSTSSSGSSSGKTGSSSSSGGSSSGGSSGGSSSGGSSSGSLPDSCTPVATSCVKGGSMSYCISYTGNTCSKITYKHDGVSASCACNQGGTDCTDAYYVAYTDCQDAKGACAELDSCCDTIDSNYEPSCRSYVSTYQGQNYGDISCKSVLTSWQSNGLCP